MPAPKRGKVSTRKRRAVGGSGGAHGLRLSWRQLALFRAQRHRLDQRAPRGSMLRVAGEICGLHAQVLSSAELSLWARVEQLPPEAVTRALWTQNTLVKTWAMRGTLHLLPRADLPVFFGALSTYTHFLKQGWVRYFGVTPEEVEAVTAALAQVLPGRVLTREALAAEVAGRTGSKKFEKLLQQSWGVMLKPAAFRGELCFAENDGRRARFTHPGVVKRWGGPEACRELARRYLSAYGPATRQDFSAWWGEPVARAQALLGELDTVEVEVEGTRALLLKRDVPRALAARSSTSVRLLPAFDPYVVGAPRRGGLFPPLQRPRIYRGQGWISATLVVDGRIEGVWRQERKGRKLALRVEPFGRTSANVRSAAAAEAEKLAAFLGCTLQSLSWSGERPRARL